MAITPTERSICNKMVFDFNSLLTPANASKGAIRNATSAVEGLLNTTSFASEATINSAIASYLQDVDDNLPDTSELAELAALLNNCAYLKDLSPVSIVASSINSAVAKIDSLLNNVGTTLPEFNMGKLVSSINDLLFGHIPGADRISQLLQNSDKLIQCLSAYCGGEYPTQVSNFTQTVDELYGELNVDGDPISANYGKYDMQSLYNSAGVSSADQAKVTSVINSADLSKAAAINKIDSVVGGIKNLI
jgi:hypothetical protein